MAGLKFIAVSEIAISLAKAADAFEGIKDVVQLGSYRTRLSENGKGVNMLTPGIPDRYHPERAIGKIPYDEQIPGMKDSRDTHGATLLPRGLSVHELAFRALTSPSALADVDIFLNRNSPRKLYRLLLRVGADDEPEPFRMDAELIEGLVALHRWEPSEKQHPEMEGSMGTERMIKYTLSDVRAAVCFDVDATTDDAAPLARAVSEQKHDTAKRGDRLTVNRIPFEDVSQGSLLEIKTRKVPREPDLVDLYGQLVFSQTPRLIVARHIQADYARGDRTEYRLGQGALAEIAEHQAPTLEAVGKVLAETVAAVKKHGDVSFISAGDKIKVLRRKARLNPLSEQAISVIRAAKQA